MQCAIAFVSVPFRAMHLVVAYQKPLFEQPPHDVIAGISPLYPAFRTEFPKGQ